MQSEDIFIELHSSTANFRVDKQHTFYIIMTPNETIQHRRGVFIPLSNIQ